MKRVGEKGAGQFERISWEEALGTVAREFRRIGQTYGPAANAVVVSGGDMGLLHGGSLIFSVLSMAGGYTPFWGSYSYEGGLFAEYATYGTSQTRSSRDDLLNSRLILMWGWNPAVTIQDTPTNYILAEAKKTGIRVIAVDPRFTESAATFADQWIPIRPGTDCAALLAMAYVIIKDNRHDQRFLDTYTVGFDRFKAYVLGIEDGIPRTPSWAEAITNVPGSTIEHMAREYADAKPAALIAGISPGRTARGEQYHRAAMALAAITGNVGVPGGSAAGRCHTTLMGYPFMRTGVGVGFAVNPLLPQLPRRKSALRAYFEDPLFGWTMAVGAANRQKVSDAILKGKAGGYPHDYKLLFVFNNNVLNQSLNSNKTAKALKSLEFMVTTEQFVTPTARYADILLPVCTFLERNDVCMGEGIPVYGYQNKVIEPLGDSRSPLEIAIGLARHLGILDFCDKTDDELLRSIMAEAPIGSYEKLKKLGYCRVEPTEPYVAFREQIQDLTSHPFPTPSGKIEIFSQEIADWHDQDIPPIPKYMEAWEGPNDPLRERYPLQLITTHFRRRAHSQFEYVPWLKDLEPQTMLINPADAAARGIEDRDRVTVFNDRGKLVIMARVTERIVPGVVDIPEGAWYDPDENGVDRGGCCNVLTRDEHSPGGALCSNTCLVEVQKLSSLEQVK
jgi:anaerobic dimethyl sulfoxide reductase subunit A